MPIKLYQAIRCIVLLAVAVSIASTDDSKSKASMKVTSVSSTFPSELWLGTSPFCAASSDSCEWFDLDFVREDSYGDGSMCFTGKKVLCRQKVLDVKLENSANNELVVGVYNVHEPTFTSGHYGQTERTCHIPRALLNKYPDLDVIILVGLFIGGCIHPEMAMGQMFAYYGFGHATNIVGEADRPIFSSNGGTVIVSKWPIISTREMVYENFAGLERFVGKGVVYAGINKRGYVYHVLGTQLQAGSENTQVRLDQAQELAVFIRDLELPSKHPVIIGGDFKSDWLNNREVTSKLFNTMFATMPTIIGEVKANVDAQVNELMKQPEANPLEWQDYIVFTTSHQAANKATLESVRLLADKDITYCASAKLQPNYVSPTAFSCSTKAQTRELSDHYPVIGRFTFNDQLPEEAPKAHELPVEDASGGYDNEKWQEGNSTSTAI